ncbi:conjugative transposon protein TraN [Arachidicoccus sp.]|uniref:conjugative transposon protein TraN n=1 Tax=Arachidicoccus sp. TaxID=1872624 RepID=UPI003D2538CD
MPYSTKIQLRYVSAFIMVIGMLCYNGCNPLLANNIAKVHPQKPPLQISISYNKTTNLIFPFAIKSVDRGSQAVLAQIAAGADNILQIKAATQHFVQTNLTVITTGGHFYSFLLSYNFNPSQLNFILSEQDCLHSLTQSLNAMTHPAIEANAQTAAAKKSNLHIRKTNGDILFMLKGLYVKNNVFYFKLAIENNSPIDYNISQLRFFTCDKKKIRRTASQQLELLPLLKSNTNATV